MADQTYLLGIDEQELDRLGFQHEVWAAETTRLWDQAEFGFGQRIADLGAGPGHATLSLARRVGPQGRVEAVEAAADYLAYLQASASRVGLHNIRPHHQDVLRLSLPADSLDGAFARWLLCFLPEPEPLIRLAYQALRPGGRLVVMDYFHYAAVRVIPGTPALTALFEAFAASVRQVGGSYDIGQRLPVMMKRQGFTLDYIEPICRIARPKSLYWHWFRRFADNFLPRLIEMGLLEAQQISAIRRDLEQASANPDTLFFTPPMVGIIARKPVMP